MVMNGLKSEDENTTRTLVSDSKNSVYRIVSLLGLRVARKASRQSPKVWRKLQTVPGSTKGHHY